MKRILYLTLTLLLTLTFFVGCNNRKHSGSSTLPATPPNIAKPSGNQSAGIVDGVGGNTFMGKPLESYVINVRDLPVFKDHVSVIIQTQALRETNVKQAIDFILDKKTWYMIPAELKELPAEIIASAVGTEQTALQDFHQVWLNQNIFDNMKTKEQTTVLVNEIVMGLKLFKFDSALRECRARYFGRHSEQYCVTSYADELRGKPSDLTSIDYGQIRSATSKILKQGKIFSFQDWNDLLYFEGFGTSVHEYIPKETQAILPLNQLGKMIADSKLAKSWPTLGYNFSQFIQDHPELMTPGRQLPEMLWKPDSKCNFDIEVKGDEFAVTVNETVAKKRYFSRWTRVVDSILRQDSLEKNYYSFIDSPPLRQTKNAKIGDEVLFVTLKFAGQLLMGAEFDKMVCLNSDCSESATAVNGYKMICSVKSALKLSPKNK